jgi:pyruvate kinase
MENQENKEKNIKAIVTMPPYAPYLNEVLEHPIVLGIRLNTVMPVKESYEDLLKRLNEQTQKKGKEFWLDLKCRQLRIADFGVPPFTEIKLSHEIEVYTPCKAYFSDRAESATILEVNGNKLIMQDGPKRVVGPGESVTITHPTLEVKGYLTDCDKKYIEAGNKAGVNKYMLSFVESNNDIAEFRKYSKDSKIKLKIESQKGIDYVVHNYEPKKDSEKAGLMAARGDLYMQLHWPHRLVEALETILEKDNNAIAASRLFSSLADNPEPKCEEVFDADSMLRMGYKTFMFGDEVCLKKESILSALNLFEAVSEKYQ